MLEYPPKINDSDFNDSGRSSSSKSLRLSLSRSANDLQTTNKLDVAVCGIEELRIEAVGTGKSCQHSFTQREEVASATDQQKRFHFAPLIEELKIHWKLKGAERVKALELELFRNVAGNAERLWMKRMVWKKECPAVGETGFNGSMRDEDAFRKASGEADVEIVNEAPGEDFPDACLTVEHAPYQLRLTLIPLEDVLAAPEVRFLYLDVLVHSIEMEWGTDALVPQARPDVTEDAKHAGYRAKVLAYEKTILQELKTAQPRPDINGVVHEIKLNSNLFSVTPKGQPSTEADTPVDYQEYKALWGNGPRIPLLAKVRLRKSDGSAVKADDPAADKDLQSQAVLALGKSRVIWDWGDNAAQRWKDPLSNGATGRTQAFLDHAHNQHNRPSHPTNSCNCPKDLGGKRGDEAADVFPADDGTSVLGFKVEKCGVRKWASFSSFGKDDQARRTTTTGVLFQPARQAGDIYNVVAYLDFAQKPDALTDINTNADLKSIPAKFKVLRRVKVTYLVRGTPARLGCNPTTLANSAKAFYLREADLELDVTVTPVDEQQYLVALKQAIEDVIVQENAFDEFSNVPILLRNLVNTNDPPADGPAISLYSKQKFLQNVEQQFQTSRMRAVFIRAAAGSRNKNLIVGQTSGAKGQIVSLQGTNPEEGVKSDTVRNLRLLVLLDAGSAEFQDGEDVRLPKTGKQAEATTKARASAMKSCWGHAVTIEEDTSPAHKEAISVSINGVTTVLNYEKAFASRKLKDELSSREKRRLIQALEMAAGQQNETQPMTIKLCGRIHSVKAEQKRQRGVAEDQIEDNAAERMRLLKEFVEEQFTNYVVLDRKQLFVAYTTNTPQDPSWLEVSDYKYSATCTKEIATWLFSPLISNYVTNAYPGTEGVLLMHVAGRTNAPQLTDFKNAVKDLRITGGYFPDATQKRNSGVVFLSSLAPALAASNPCRTPESIINHELGHALFLPHQVSSVPGNRSPEAPAPATHIEKDNCMMNYDLDAQHFCGMCMLRLRGWNWDAMKTAVVAEQYEYKLELSLGDIDELYAPVHTPQGQKERLQALGLFSHPLQHPKSDECLRYSLEHARQLGLFVGANVAALKPLIEEFLLEGHTLPAPGGFARMRLPKWNLLYAQSNMKTLFPEDFKDYATPQDLAEKEYSEKFMLGADPYAVDQLYFKDNPTLGKIPLVARVKRRPKGTGGAWLGTEENAPDVAVYFQLIPPDPLPAYAVNPAPPATPLAGGRSFYNQVKAPPPASVPQTNLGQFLQAGAANDPDRENAAEQFGGKRVGKNTATVFCGTRAEDFGPLSSATGPGHTFSARVITDQTGTAKLCFNPSTVGGDKYKLRVYVGPPTQQKNGQPLGDDALETLTMVRWRTVRISHSLYMPAPATDLELPPEINVRANHECDHPPVIANAPQTGRVCANCLRRYGTLPPVDLRNALTLELAKAYTELILEPAALAPVSVSTIGPALLQEVDDLLTAYPRLNSLYWVRRPPPDHFLDVELHKFPLTHQGGSGDKIFAAILPYFDEVVMGQDGRACLVPNPNGRSPLLRVAEARLDGTRGEDVLLEKTGDGNLTDTGKVAGGVQGDFDYSLRTLVVQFAQPQTGKQYYAWYPPTKFLDFHRLLYFPNRSPFLFNLRMPTDYNAELQRTGSGAMPMDAPADPVKGRPSPAYHFKYIDSQHFGAIKGLLMLALGRAVTRYPGVPSGFCPGLVFVRAQALDTYEGVWGTGVQEGKSVGNTIYVFGGTGSPPASGLASLVLHETSHGLYLVHAPSAPGNKPERHDAPASFRCVMSYDANTGDFCGKCLAAMKGMKIT